MVCVSGRQTDKTTGHQKSNPIDVFVRHLYTSQKLIFREFSRDNIGAESTAF